MAPALLFSPLAFRRARTNSALCFTDRRIISRPLWHMGSVGSRSRSSNRVVEDSGL